MGSSSPPAVRPQPPRPGAVSRGALLIAVVAVLNLTDPLVVRPVSEHDWADRIGTAVALLAVLPFLMRGRETARTLGCCFVGVVLLEKVRRTIFGVLDLAQDFETAQAILVTTFVIEVTASVAIVLLLASHGVSRWLHHQSMAHRPAGVPSDKRPRAVTLAAWLLAARILLLAAAWLVFSWPVDITAPADLVFAAIMAIETVLFILLLRGVEAARLWTVVLAGGHVGGGGWVPTWFISIAIIVLLASRDSVIWFQSRRMEARR